MDYARPREVCSVIFVRWANRRDRLIIRFAVTYANPLVTAAVLVTHTRETCSHITSEQPYMEGGRATNNAGTPRASEKRQTEGRREVARGGERERERETGVAGEERHKGPLRL